MYSFSLSNIIKFGLIISPIITFAQSPQRLSEEHDRTFEYAATLQGFASTAQTPFWMRANEWGTVPFQGNSLLPRLAVRSDYAPGRKISWGAKVEAIGQIGKESRILIPEAHIKAKWGKLEIFAGRKRQIMGMVGDTTLSSGSLVESGNALPIPRIEIGFTDYVTIFNGLFGFKGNYAHGFFDTNPITKNHFLHQKSFYARLGKPSWAIRLYGGFNHNAQWGGTIVRPNYWTAPGQTSYPSKWIDYWYVISGKRIPTFGYVDPNEYDAIDRGNRIGNHLGSVDLGVEIRQKNWSIFLYRQNFYEDGSLFQLINLRDGLNGIAWKNKAVSDGNSFFIKAVTAEFLYMVHQGGSHFDLTGGTRGRDNYYNHAQYHGWVYNQNTIGTPLITPKTDTKKELPSGFETQYSNNNRVAMAYLAVSGNWNQLKFLLKTSISDNKGLYHVAIFPTKTYQVSTLIRLEYPVQIMSVGTVNTFLGIANDNGTLFENSTGIQIGLKKTGVF